MLPEAEFTYSHVQYTYILCIMLTNIYAHSVKGDEVREWHDPSRGEEI